MNFKTTFLALSILCVVYTNISALTVDNPFQIIGKGKWGLTFETSSIQERDLSSLTTKTTDVSSGVLDKRNMLAGKVLYGLLNGMNIYFIGGSTEWNFSTEWTDGSKTRFGYNEAPVFGGGLKFVHANTNNLLVGCDFQFAVTSGMEVERIHENNIKAVITQRGEADFEEYQLSFFLGKHYQAANKIKIIPYTGVLFNGYNFEIKQLEYNTWPWYYKINMLELEEDDNFGLFLGTGIGIGEHFLLNAEARFLSDKAVSASASFKF